MIIELINTGAELMLGRRLNTHAQWLCAQLSDRGYSVARQETVDDTGPAIRGAVVEAMTRAELIITTGGLGPTSDDRTRDLIAELLGLPLHEDQNALRNIEQFFALRRGAIPENTRRQAMVPANATVLANAHGTAPGLALNFDRPQAVNNPGLLIMLPGPPRELYPMFLQQAWPLIEARFPQCEPYFSRTFRTTGIGESFLEEKIATPLKHLTDAGLDLAYCARPGEVDLRLSMRGDEAAKTVTAAEEIVTGLLGELVFARNDDSLEAVIIQLLTSRRQTLATAESCTGGLIAHRCTNVPGASAVFLAGLVTYSNAAKEKFVGVAASTLLEPGAVSEPTAREMAEGARRNVGSDYALAVTGIAGPTGGSDAKPVGTVFIALAGPKRTLVQRHFNSYDRETFKEVTAQQALELLRREIIRG